MTHTRSDLPAAVLWDMDGTLVDTEPYWFASERDLVESFGGDWPDEMAEQIVGFDLLDGARFIREHSPVELTPDEIVDRLLDGVIERLHQSIPWRPGARELLADLNSAGVPCVLVTMSWRRFADPVLDALPAGSFVASITGDEVPEGRGKPHPDPYLMGADACAADPADCVAIEDSPTGVRSAVAAGCRVIGVPNAAALDDVDGLTIVDTLAGLHPSDLLAVTGGGDERAAPPVSPRSSLRGRPQAVERPIDPGLATGSPSARRLPGPRALIALAAVVIAVIVALAIAGGDDTSSDPSRSAATEPAFDEWITFPEGLTIEQMAGIIAERRPDLDPAAFVDAAAVAEVPAAIAPPAGTTSREGLLFPNTYRVQRSGDVTGLVDQMVGLMRTVAVDEEGIVDGAAALGRTPYEILTVASMIEEEAGVDDDRAKIARVIYNRLERSMPLQIDATLYYGRDRSIPFSELREIESPYNSYLTVELPPTPISNPGRASIRAALDPAADPDPGDPLCDGLPDGDCAYLFYVLSAADDGSHVFAATYEQHLANIEAARAAGVF